jgi:Rrf2 family protein
MKLSKKGRYGRVALTDLASHANEGCVTLVSIADRNGISLKYLEQVFASFKRAGIVRSIKGPQGGYTLAKPEKDLKVSEIVAAIEGDYHLEDENVYDTSTYQNSAIVLQDLIISPVNKAVDEILESLSLEDLRGAYDKGSPEDMYYI